MKKPKKSHASQKKNAAKPAAWRAALPWLPCLLMLIVPALTFSSGARETFRLPKLLVSELLALVTWLFLATRLWKVGHIDWRALTRHPAVRLMAPLLVVASLTWWASVHRHHVTQGLVSLWIGGLSVVLWSLGWRSRELFQALRLLVVPGVLLSLLGLLQYYGVVELFEFRDTLQDRIAMTSLAGGAFDLAAYLVLPALVAQLAFWQAAGRWPKVAWALAWALFVYVIAVTRTLSAIAGLLLASAVFWGRLLPRRRLWRLGLGLGTVVLAALIVLVPLRLRLLKKVDQFSRGKYNQVLNGRLDGWRTALWMLEKEPLLGVGHGAYRAEFGNAKLALREAGVPFYRLQHRPYFVNAHNEPLEAAAEWGSLGILALLVAVVVLWRRLRQRGRQLAAGAKEALDAATADSKIASALRAQVDQRRGELALMWSGLVALAVMSSGNFPLRIALVAYPFLILLAWVLQSEAAPEPHEEGP